MWTFTLGILVNAPNSTPFFEPDLIDIVIHVYPRISTHGIEQCARRRTEYDRVWPRVSEFRRRAINSATVGK